ncbi:hypothetical protein [Propionibacterium freudenreichii]|uniref:hypothetical protein n=1 Tax=Propionibacterium freudenreichii TaxID=1744 RepID=UPI00254CFE35|nr:hypothetical protein [Propionibacterium freudenreichii]MDK9661428.1 hypothetical protein [Propionibacterium freudenreichii]
MTDSVYDLLVDDDCARTFVLDNIGLPGRPGAGWGCRDPRRSAIEIDLRGAMLLTRATLALIRDDVEEARQEGLAWAAIAEALDLPAETVQLIYGGVIRE